MDYDAATLIGAFCTRPGMIMEDVSVVALTTADAVRTDIEARLMVLANAAQAIGALTAAAQAILAWSVQS